MEDILFLLLCGQSKNVKNHVLLICFLRKIIQILLNKEL
jgi:hypothetical protein